MIRFWRRSSTLARVSAILGGAVWLLHTVLLAARPPGCVGSACFELGRHHRPSEDLAWVLLLSVTFLAVSAGVQAARRESPRARIRVAGFALLAFGAVLLVLGLVLNAVSPGGSPLWWLHDSDTLGRLLPVAGTVLIGIALWRDSGSRSLGGAFLVAALIGLAFNAQDERALLSLPVGIVWMAAGLAGLPVPEQRSRVQAATSARRL